MGWRPVLFMTAAAVAWSLQTGISSAAGGGGTVETGGTTVDGVPTVVLVQGGGGSTIATVELGGSGPAWSCHYVELGGLLEPTLRGPVTPEAGSNYFITCDDATGVQVYGSIVTYDPANPAGPVFVARRAAELAFAQLDVPDPDITGSPGLGEAQLVGVRTWLWVANWGPVTAQATLGGVTATVTATPVGATFDTGDGTVLDCDDGGVPFDVTIPADEQPTACTHVYVDRTTVDDPSGDVPLTATVTYAVSWTATNGQSGSLADVVRSASLPVTVREAQAVIR